MTFIRASVRSTLLLTPPFHDTIAVANIVKTFSRAPGTSGQTFKKRQAVYFHTGVPPNHPLGDTQSTLARVRSAQDSRFAPPPDPHPSPGLPQNTPYGEELLRQRYRLSTAEVQEDATGARLPWGGEEEELICGGYANKATKSG